MDVDEDKDKEDEENVDAEKETEEAEAVMGDKEKETLLQEGLIRVANMLVENNLEDAVVLAFELTKKYDVQNVFGYVNNLGLNYLEFIYCLTDLLQRKKLTRRMILTLSF